MVTPHTMARRWIITGERGVGKTTFCRRFAEMAGAAGWDVAGLLSLPRYEGEVKTGIQILALRGGESRMMASTRPDEFEGSRFCGWSFNDSALAWGNEILQRATPCDLLILDEVGPLEFDTGSGLTACFQVLEKTSYRLAIAVVRPAYEARFRLSWMGSKTIAISSPKQALKLAEARFAELRRPVGNPYPKGSTRRNPTIGG